MVIQFVVITNGAGRVAEVGARFTLDAMPGKQMAIDADLNAGLIDEDEARRRRAEVHAEADFYGAMDGASKFVKGDAIAAIIITLVNLIGGFAIGVVQQGMSSGEAITTYSLLTVGDGLVSQIPALLLSVATGLIVTRVGHRGRHGLRPHPRSSARNRMPLRIAGVAALVAVPDPRPAEDPVPPRRRRHAARVVAGSRSAEEDAGGGRDRRSRRCPLAATPPRCSPPRCGSTRSSLELSADLVDLVDPRAGGDLLDRVKALRRKIAARARHRHPAGAHPRQPRPAAARPTRSSSSASRSARGEAPPGTVLAIGDSSASLPGRADHASRSSGWPRKWIPAELRSQAELSRRHRRRPRVGDHHAPRRGRHAATPPACSAARTSGCSPTSSSAPTPSSSRSSPRPLLSLGEVQRVLQALLDEGVSIRDLVRIFEALSLRAAGAPRTSTRWSRRRAPRSARRSSRRTSSTARVHVISFDPQLEQRMLEGMRPGEQGAMIALDPVTGQPMLTQLSQFLTEAENQNIRPVLVCAPQIRAAVRRMVRPALPSLAVVSYQELTGANQVRSVGVVTGERATVTA